jgi:carbamoyl-phosphate synthase/aspartate carbamoyltransferase/dihydroorotase
MPNTHPPIVTLDDLRAVQRRIAAEAHCDVHHFAGASADHVDALPALGREAVGLKIYMDQTYGPLRVDSLAALLACFRRWPRHKPIACHAEGRAMAIVIGLAGALDRPVHLCHVSRREEVALIAHAKANGIPVTCEVTPHHLFLTQEDADCLGPLGDMRPRLAEQADVDALWDHIDHTIDCVATDHAPHTLAEKHGASGRQDAPPPGVPGLETALPLMLTAVSEGRLTMERLVTLMAEAPRRIFKLPIQPDTWTEVDLDTSYTLRDEGLHTKCGWSPFSGRRVRGRVHRVQLRGRLVVQEGALMPLESFH